VILAEKCSQFGQRAFVGKANINVPRDDGYYESTEKSIETTKAFIKAVEEIGVNANLYLISCTL